jgi:hypothetical protein
MAGTSPAMTREKWFNITGIRSKLATLRITGCPRLKRVKPGT